MCSRVQVRLASKLQRHGESSAPRPLTKYPPFSSLESHWPRSSPLHITHCSPFFCFRAIDPELFHLSVSLSAGLNYILPHGASQSECVRAGSSIQFQFSLSTLHIRQVEWKCPGPGRMTLLNGSLRRCDYSLHGKRLTGIYIV
ncbi:unnamed protein product [Mycena citricolor]|uniref:Uncharacterized protein n=1 Tax=Mycena citricolor TaxID=2018698 RepID=A0AAD2HY31_9AGAR|nr:unnamed protein product [Mycena citricolor]